MNSNRALTLALMLAVVLFSGCLGDSDNPTQETIEGLSIQGQEILQLEVHHISQYTQAAIPGGMPVPTSEGYGGLILPFETPHKATSILLEVAWNETTQDLDAKLFAEHNVECQSFNFTCLIIDPPNAIQTVGNEPFGEFVNDDGMVGIPDSPSRILVEGETLTTILEHCDDPCPWVAGSGGKGPYIDIEWHAYVTIFYDMEIPEGYTAIPWLQQPS